MATNSPAQDLNDLLITRNLEVNMLDSKTGRPPVNEKGQPDPSKADNFTFDWVTPQGKNYGTVEILLGAENNMLVASGDNTASGMEPEDKQEWYDFLMHLRNFAKQNLLTFDITNFNRLKFSKQGQAALTESFTGNKHYSFTGNPTEARLMIKHNKVMQEQDARFRYIESLFIETNDGERFKLKTRSLIEGRAQLQHVREGGRPWDARGQHISEMVEQAKVLSQFRRAHHGKMFEAQAQQLVTETEHYYQNLRKNIKSLSTRNGYQKYFESWNPNALTEQDMVVEDIKELFIETRIDPRIEQALPLLAQIKESNMKEADIFESWINNLAEGTWELPETPEQLNKLKELMSKELIAGPDGTNATEQLYDLVGDDALFDLIEELAEANPDANIWEDERIISRLEQLGINMPETSNVANPGEETVDVDNDETVDDMAQNADTNKNLEEGAMDEADMVIQDLVRGDLDAYTVMTRPTTPSEQYVSKIMQDIYDDVSIDQRLHPDDDFEQILDIVIDRLADDYGVDPEVKEADNLSTLEDNTPGALGFFKEELARLKSLASLK
jgi:hypothetical protein